MRVAFRPAEGVTDRAAGQLKRLTQIGNEAARHCGNVVGIGRIGFVAVWARRAGAPAATGPSTQERPVDMVFANPPRIVASGAVPHRRAPSNKGKSMPVEAVGSKRSTRRRSAGVRIKF